MRTNPKVNRTPKYTQEQEDTGEFLLCSKRLAAGDRVLEEKRGKTQGKYHGKDVTSKVHEAGRRSFGGNKVAKMNHFISMGHKGGGGGKWSKRERGGVGGRGSLLGASWEKGSPYEKKSSQGPIREKQSIGARGYGWFRRLNQRGG